jgi:hypothetical protein
VALVARDAVHDFARTIAAGFERAVGLQPAVYVCRATGGASLDPPMERAQGDAHGNPMREARQLVSCGISLLDSLVVVDDRRMTYRRRTATASIRVQGKIFRMFPPCDSLVPSGDA